MSEEELIMQYKKLPPEARQEAADFVTFLTEKYIFQEEKRSATKKSILDSSFRGIWKNRGDMKDSTEWVRKVRKSRWTN
jgi:hypothetical protein